MTLEIFLPDLGHGNCVGFFNDNLNSFIVDCGTNDNWKIQNFDALVFNRLMLQNRVSLAITHYHTDHYNLIHKFRDRFFDVIFVPALPRHSQTADIILHFLSLSTVFNHREYYLSSELVRKTQHIRALVKGDTFTTFNLDWDVIWPDYSLIDKINKKRIIRIQEKINDLVADLSDDDKEEFERVYRYLSRAYSENEPDYENRPKFDWNKEINFDVVDKLNNIEKKFRQLANRTSLVFFDFDGNYLFTGDVDDVCLNRYVQFNNDEYLLIETPHHGGYYGKAFNNVKTHYLLISRKSSDRPRCEYFQNVSWEILIDTARIGNSKINPQNKNFLYDI